MSDALDEAKSIFRSLRITLAISGALALIAGIVVLVWPTKSAVVLTIVFAIYLLVAGLVYIGLGLFSGKYRGWARTGHVVLGVLYIVAAVVAFANPAQTALTLAFIVVLFIGVSWIVDGIVALTLLGQDGSRVWTLLYALLSVIAGVFVVLSPIIAGFVFWIFLGVSLVVLGIAQIIRAIAFGRGAKSIVAEAKEELGAE